MEINGREIGFFYSVLAHIKADRLVSGNPSMPVSEWILHKAVFMSEAYNKAHGIKEGALTLDEIYSLPNSKFDELVEAVKKQEEEDTKTKVQVKEKKAKSAARES